MCVGARSYLLPNVCGAKVHTHSDKSKFNRVSPIATQVSYKISLHAFFHHFQIPLKSVKHFLTLDNKFFMTNTNLKDFV